MTIAATSVGILPLDPLTADVWSRTGAKYRRRSIALLLIDFFLFACLACVAYWLRSGVAFAPAAEGYWDTLAATFDPTLQTKHTPTGLSLGPISIQQVPMMIVVLGLLLAALVSIPVLVAVLYRFPFSIPFVGLVGFIAVMPWLAIVLLASCALAAVRPFRFRSRFASGLMSLLPVMLYFFFASRSAQPPVEILTNPADRTKLMAPLVLAVIAAAATIGAVLVIARWVNYRPGAIAPLLAVLLLTPAFLFEFKVGRDELHYRLLEKKFGPASSAFAALTTRLHEAILDAPSRPSGTPPAEEAESMDQEGRGPNRGSRVEPALILTQYQDGAVRAAEDFVRQFPDSPYACSALYMGARALDLRLEAGAFTTHAGVEFHEDFPCGRSRRLWELIEANGAASPTVAVALLRLAKLDARDGQLDHASARVNRLLSDFAAGDERTHTGRGEPDASDSIMRRRPAESSLGIPLRPTRFEGARLRVLLEENREPALVPEPVSVLFRFDPHSEHYPIHLTRLRNRFAQSRLVDNLELELAMACKTPGERLKALESCAAAGAESDALPEAIYHLGLAYSEMGKTAEAQASFQRVQDEFAASPWNELARSRLRQPTPTPQ